MKNPTHKKGGAGKIGGDPAGRSMKKRFMLRVVSLFMIINIPGKCDGNLMDL